MWTTDPAEYIAEQFRRLEVPVYSGMLVIDPSRKAEKVLAHYHDNKHRIRPKENARRKAKAMSDNIDKWKQSGKMICGGRELDTSAWREVLLDPSCCDEVDARDDFIVFLKRCRNVADSHIAGMLGISVNDVWMVLSSRPQK